MNRDSKGSPTVPSSNSKPTLSDLAKKNPSQLGDPVSLKAEASDTHPTENDLGAGPQPRKTMPAPSNPTALGDPVSLKAESKPDSAASGSSNKKSATGPGSLADRAKKNPTALGDPVSLKSETSDSEPTEHDRGAKGASDKSKL